MKYTERQNMKKKNEQKCNNHVEHADKILNFLKFKKFLKKF